RSRPRLSTFDRAGVDGLLSQSFQPHAGWHARWRPHRDRSLALALVTRIRSSWLAGLEISELHCLDPALCLAPANLLPFPQTHRGRTTLLRSLLGAAL